MGFIPKICWKKKADKPMKGVKKMNDMLVRIIIIARMRLFMLPKAKNLFCNK
jgi:hypothetical protein